MRGVSRGGLKTLALGALALVGCATAPTPTPIDEGKGSDPTPDVSAPLEDLSTFDACRRDVAPGMGVFYLCEHLRFGAFISEIQPWPGAKQAEELDHFARTTGERIHGPGGEVTAQAGQFSLGVDSAPQVDYRAAGFGEGAPDFEGRFVAAPVQGGVRVVACITTSQWGFERCDDVLSLLVPARTYEALRARYRSSAPVMAGRTVPVPEGCQKTGARTITCDRSELAMSAVDLEELPQAELEMQADHRSFIEELCGGQGQAWSASCQLDGADAVCHIGRCVDDQGAIAAVVVMAQVRGEGWAASCRFDPQQHGELPPVCAEVIKLRAEALNHPGPTP